MFTRLVLQHITQTKFYYSILLNTVLYQGFQKRISGLQGFMSNTTIQCNFECGEIHVAYKLWYKRNFFCPLQKILFSE